MTARRRATVAICATALAVGASYAERAPIGRADRLGAGQQQSALTFTRDVAPIVFSACAPCHRPEGSRAVFPAHLPGRQEPRRADRRGDARPRDAALEAGTWLRSVRRRAAADRRADRDASSMVRRWRRRRRSAPCCPRCRHGAASGRSENPISCCKRLPTRCGPPATTCIETSSCRSRTSQTRYVRAWQFLAGKSARRPSCHDAIRSRPDRRAGSTRRIRSPATKG